MIQQLIETKLRDVFTPEYLQVVNESYMHNVAPGSESHFNIIVVSSSFEEQRLISRHRQVNQTLSEELRNHVHALAIHTYTPQEWENSQKQTPDSPMCLGG